MVLTKIMTSKEKTNAFAVIQGILSESGPAGFYSGIQVRAVSAHLVYMLDLLICCRLYSIYWFYSGIRSYV